MIKAVLFDLYHTLVYSRPEETFQKILAEHGIAKSIDHIKQALTQGNKEFDADKHVGLSAHEFYAQWNLLPLKHLGIRGSEGLKMAEEIETKWYNYGEFHLYPDVQRTVQKLKQMTLKLGIISGGYAEDIERVLQKIGLERLFDLYVGVNTTGKRKPHPKVFKYALRQLGVRPREAIFVGDNFEADYLGAEKVGLIPVLINREASQNQRLFTNVCLHPSSDVKTIKRLYEIFRVIEEISS